MRTKKAMLKKIVALCMAAMMTLAMGLTAFAAINLDSKGTITVTGLETDNGAALKAYKLIDVSFDETNQQVKEPVYTWVSGVAGWVKDNYVSYIGANNEVTDAYRSLSASELHTMYAALETAMKAGSVTLTEAASSTIANETAAMDVAMGQYLILAEKAGAVYQPMVANVYPEYNADNEEWNVANTEVVLKGSAPSIEKDASTEDNDQSVAIGDTVDYKLTVDIPSYPADATVTRFVIGDQLSQGLTLDTDSVKFYAGTVETSNLLTGDTHYTQVILGANAFEFAMDYEAITKEFPDAAEIIVVYEATVNANAFVADALGNKAYIGYTNDPYNDSDSKTEIEEDVYTYGIDLTKKDADDKQTALAGAEFELRETESGDALQFVKTQEDGVYRLALATDTDQDKVTVLEVSTDGKLSIQGLDLGTYYLKETVAPEGYVLPEENVVIVLGEIGTEDGELDTATVTPPQNSVVTAGSVTMTANKAAFDLYNKLYDGNFNLPKTGGMGTIVFTIAGILLMAGAASMIVISKKRSRSN